MATLPLPLPTGTSVRRCSEPSRSYLLAPAALRGLHLDRSCAAGVGLPTSRRSKKMESPGRSTDHRENEASTKPGVLQNRLHAAHRGHAINDTTDLLGQVHGPILPRPGSSRRERLNGHRQSTFGVPQPRGGGASPSVVREFATGVWYLSLA